MSALLPISPGLRASLVTAAVCTTASLGAAMLSLFDQTSPKHWIAASPEVLEAVSRCEELRERQPRQMCLKRVVAQRSGDAPAAPLNLARQASHDAMR